jgi:hypothetical protein
MQEFTLHECSLHVDKANAQGMVRGFVKDGPTVFYSSILTDKASGNYERLWRYSSMLPRLITPLRKNTDYRLSKWGIPLEGYHDFELKYVAFLDTVFHLKRVRPDDDEMFEMWNKLCNLAIFDIWEAKEGPIKNLQGSDRPMILLLRVCEIDQEFDSSELAGKRFLKFTDSKPRTVRVVRLIIRNETFSQLRNLIQEKVSKCLDKSMRRPINQWQDTCRLLAKVE